MDLVSEINVYIYNILPYTKLYELNLFSTNIPYMEHHFHELILAQWGLIFGIINALLH